MPRVPACAILVFLLCQLTGPAASGALQELVGALGGSVTFPLTQPVNHIDSIVWVFNTTTLLTIQPKVEGRQDNVIVIQNHNKERVGFPHGDYSLQLSRLNKSDAGTYRVEIYSPSLRAPFIRKYELRVYEHLSKPKVTMGLQNNKNGTCVTNLTCSLEQGGDDVTYSWESPGQAANASHNGPVLPMSWALGEKDMTFICMARNPISSNSSNPVSARKLCEGAAGDLGSTVVPKVLGVSLLLSVLVLVPVTLTLWRERGKASIEEKRRTSPHQQVLQCHPPSQETSEYDTISTFNKTVSEENSGNMLYFTVQIPAKMEKPHPLPTSPDTPRPFTYENVI